MHEVALARFSTITSGDRLDDVMLSRGLPRAASLCQRDSLISALAIEQIDQEEGLSGHDKYPHSVFLVLCLFVYELRDSRCYFTRGV